MRLLMCNLVITDDQLSADFLNEKSLLPAAFNLLPDLRLTIQCVFIFPDFFVIVFRVVTCDLMWMGTIYLH